MKYYITEDSRTCQLKGVKLNQVVGWVLSLSVARKHPPAEHVL